MDRVSAACVGPSRLKPFNCSARRSATTTKHALQVSEDRRMTAAAAAAATARKICEGRAAAAEPVPVFAER